jgi:hypothetical protein
VEDRGTRAAIAQMIFKQRGEDLLLWVNQGAEGIRRLTQEGERWATVTGTGAKQADEFKNKINTLTHATDALAKSVAESVIPQLNTMIERMLEGARAGGGLRGAIQGFLTGSDLDKWNADFFRAVERLGAAQSNVERLQASGGWMRQGLPRATAELEAARAEIARLQAIKPIMFPEAPAAGAAAGAGGGLGRQPTLGDLEPPDTSGPDLIRQLRDQLMALKPEITMVDRAMMQLDDTTKKFSESDRAAAIIIADQIDLVKERKEGLDAWLSSELKALEVEQEAADVAARQQDQRNAALEALTQQTRTEREQLQAWLDEKLLMLDQAREMDLISAQRYEDLKTRVEDEATKKRYGISKVYRELDLDSAGFVLDQLASMMQTKNRAMFEVAKAGAIGKALIDTYTTASGAASAVASIPYVGPALAVVAAAAAIVAGMARVQAIRSTQFGGGGGAAPVYSAVPGTSVPTAPIGSSASAPPPTLPQAAAPRTRIDVTIINERADDSVSMTEVVDRWLPALQNAFDQGADLRLTLA